jgi:DNA-binding response OmpR family regulator
MARKESDMKILVVEDEKKVASFIKRGLEEEKYEVVTIHDGEEGLNTASEKSFDLIILDVMLPKMDGVSIMKELRTRKVLTPVLMLTAKDTVEDIVAGLDSGSDDYLTKPFAFDELIARLHALGRRVTGGATNTFELRVGSLVLDTHNQTARRADQPLELTKTEWTMLECFLRHPGQTLSRQFLLDYVWSYENDVQPSMVDVYISYLRSKLRLPGRKDPIQTKRGFGYFLDVGNA